MKKLLTISAFVVIAASLQAEEAFQASLTPDIAIHDKGTRINGICLSIWGENPQSAFGLGFVNGSSGDSKGFSLGLVNYSENYTGVQWAFVNANKATFIGWQSGVVNYSKEFHGLQFGLFNCSEETKNGVQIGLVNISMNNPWFSEFPNKLATGFPFVNWSF